MDLIVPLATIAPGLDSVALTVLAGVDAAMSATQIQRVAGRGSRYGLVLVLERFVEHGLVTAIPAARGNLYQLNRGHVLAPIVLAAVRVRAEVDGRLAEESGRLVPKPLSVAMFGSVARGEATAHSDLDLLIVAKDELDPDSDAWAGQVDSLERRIRLWIGNPLQVTTVTQTQLAAMVSSGAPIVDEWDRDVCTIMGQDARDLIRAARKKAL